MEEYTVRRYRRKWLLSQFVINRHNAQLPGNRLWEAIWYNCSHLVNITGNLNYDHYIGEIIKQGVISFLQYITCAVF